MSKLEFAKDAINQMFYDSSVDSVTTLDNLRELRDEIDIMSDAMREQIRRETENEEP